MKKKRYDSRKLVPVAVIKAAAAGDPLAVQMVLNHYQGTSSGCPQGPCMMKREKHIM